MFEKVIIAVLVNHAKTPVFGLEKRMELIRQSVKGFKNTAVESFDGLLVDFMRERKACVAVRGLRAVTDLEYEFQIANTNRELYPEMETAFLMPSAKYAYLASTVVREVYQQGANLDKFVPKAVAKELKKLQKK
jgi:pantetheine-phosphate adenylyltransferase